MRLFDSNRGITRAARGSTLAAALALIGACSGQVEGDSYEESALLRDTPGTKDKKNAKDKDKDKDAASMASAAAADCAALSLEVEQTLTEFCSACHANGNRMGGFGDVLDVAKMIDQTKIIPGDAGGSKLYNLVKSGAMPKTPQKPDKEAIATLHDWIECGAVDWETPAPGAASATFVSIDDRLGVIRSDLRSFDNPADRRRMRYIDLTHLANAGWDDAELQTQRSLISLLINSVSFARRVVEPVAVDKSELLYRIDLRDYALREETWERIVADYPYAVRYDEDSPLFAYDEDAAQDIREDTATDVPYVQSDWLIDHISQPPLYYEVLGIPENVDALLRDQGVDVDENIRNSDVARAGFNGSGIALNNRVLERHELPGFGGSLWLSYDFRGNVDEQNIFANPADFRQDGGEGFFTLPNGLQAYFVIDAQFRRLDKAPTDIVSDPSTRDRAVAAGLSCMGGCHLQKGVNSKDDQVRAYVLTTASSPDDRDRALELYPEADTMRALVDADVERYTAARDATGIDPSDDDALIRTVRNHEDVLTLKDVAAVLGVRTAILDQALDASPQAFPPEIVALRVKGANVYRAAFDAVVEDVVRGLGLGDPLRRNQRAADSDEDDEADARDNDDQNERAQGNNDNRRR